MIRIRVETTVSTRYPLFRLRCLMIILQIPCLALSILNAVCKSSSASLMVWTFTSVFVGVSLVASIWDLTVHKRGTTPPGSPRSLAANHHEPEPQRISTEPDQPSAHNAAVDADVTRISTEEERLSFLPPRSDSGSEKEEQDSKSDRFHPDRNVILMDSFLGVSFLVLYIMQMVIESQARRNWGYYAEHLYAARLHASIGILLAMVFHFHCLYKALKMQMDVKRKNGYRRLRAGVISI